MAKKELPSYQRKMREGRVPFQYERNSKAFNEGAHRHWAGRNRKVIARMVENDRDFLERAREAR